MVEIIIEKQSSKSDLIRMDQLQPLEVAIIKDPNHSRNGDVVMRTASRSQFEVFSLTDAAPSRCWTDNCGLRVLKVKAKITVKVFEND